MSEIDLEIEEFTLVFRNKNGVRTQLSMKGGIDPTSKAVMNYEYSEPVTYADEFIYLEDPAAVKAVSMNVQIRKQISGRDPLYTLQTLPEDPK